MTATAWDPQPQVEILREEVDRYEAVTQPWNLPPDMYVGQDEALTTFRNIADAVERGRIIDEAECQRLLYQAITDVREAREDFEMINERLGK